MLKHAIPVLHISSAPAAEEFYIKKLGFRKQFAYCPDETKPDPCYMGLQRDGAWFHLSSFSGDGVAGNVMNIIVEDIDELCRELKANGLQIDLEPTDQTWGNREMYINDPDGNSVRFIMENAAGS